MPTETSNGTGADLRELGSTGLKVFGGRVYEEELPELSGDKKWKVYKEMSEQDPVIGGMLFAIKMLIRQVGWTVQPVNASGPAKKAADFVDQCLHDMNPTYEATLTEVLSMLTFGWSWFEVVYKRRDGLKEDISVSSKYDDGKVGWRKWSIRSQDTLWQWDLEDNGDVKGIFQLAPPKYKLTYIPLSKSLHFTTELRKGNPEGVSILRNAYRPWYFKKHIETIEGIGVERDLAGLPVVWVPPRLLSSTASDDDRALLEVLKKLVTGIRRDEQEGVVMPLAYEDGHEVYKLELLSSGGQRQFDTDKIVTRYDQRIAMTAMADFILLGHESVGSFALSSDKTTLFTVAIGSYLDCIASELNDHAIPRLLKVNGIEQKFAPIVEHSDIESQNLGALADYLSKLGNAGMSLFPNEQLEKYLLETAGMPADRIWTPPPPPPPPALMPNIPTAPSTPSEEVGPEGEQTTPRVAPPQAQPGTPVQQPARAVVSGQGGGRQQGAR